MCSHCHGLEHSKGSKIIFLLDLRPLVRSIAHSTQNYRPILERDSPYHILQDLGNNKEGQRRKVQYSIALSSKSFGVRGESSMSDTLQPSTSIYLNCSS